MTQINANDRPQVLLLGNGMNRSSGGISWNDLMRKISVRNDFQKELTCPMPLQAILVTNNNVKQAMDRHKSDFYGSVGPELRETMQKLLKMGFDDILTTNYSYELEAASIGQTVVSDAFLKKTARSIDSTKRVESRYMLHSYQSLFVDDHENRVWHIHGEARKPDSMILGHYYYVSLLHKMAEFSQYRRNIYEVSQKENRPLIVKGWMDSFILGDVYILALGMDFSELDLWWLLNRKKREKANHGNVYFYTLEDPKSNEKLELLKLLEVQIVNCGMTKPTGTSEEKDLEYKKFYRLAMQDIQEKMRKTTVKE